MGLNATRRCNAKSKVPRDAWTLEPLPECPRSPWRRESRRTAKSSRLSATRTLPRSPRRFDKSTVKNKIELVVGTAANEMTNMVEKGDKFDLIFIDADKENYIEYYEIGLKLLANDGIILADNSLCALLYDQEGDLGSTRLHLFNQHVKNDPRTEQVVLTMREGITLIKPVVV